MFAHDHKITSPIQWNRFKKIEFWAKTKKIGSCLVFGKNNGKYKSVYIYSPDNGSARMMRAHRVAWMITKGEIPKGIYICHKCDNPPCVRPSHLFAGTALDNFIDCSLKGRRKRKKEPIPENMDVLRDAKLISLFNARKFLMKYGIKNNINAFGSMIRSKKINTKLVLDKKLGLRRMIKAREIERIIKKHQALKKARVMP